MQRDRESLYSIIKLAAHWMFCLERVSKFAWRALGGYYFSIPSFQFDGLLSAGGLHPSGLNARLESVNAFDRKSASQIYVNSDMLSGPPCIFAALCQLRNANTIFSIKSPFYDCHTLNPITCQKYTGQNRHHAWHFPLFPCEHSSSIQRDKVNVM